MKLTLTGNAWRNQFRAPVFCSDFGGYFTVPDDVDEVELKISKEQFPESILLELADDLIIYLPEYDVRIPTYWSIKGIVHKMNGACYIGISYEHND